MMLGKRFGFGSLCALAPLAVALVAGCSSGDSSDGDDGQGSECSNDNDCKGDRVCEDGACVDPGANSGNGGAGPSSGPSGPSSSNSSSGSGGGCSDAGEACGSGCCSGSTCVDIGDGTGLCAANCSVASDCQSNCCAELEGGGAVCAPAEYCSAPGGKAIGDACASNSECGSGNCVGWCTQYCSSSSDCPGLNWCVTNGNGDNICFPGCSDSSACYAFPGTSCQSAPTTDGFEMNVCSG